MKKDSTEKTFLVFFESEQETHSLLKALLETIYFLSNLELSFLKMLF